MRVGVVGVGRMGAVHAMNCLDHPDVDGIDLVDPAGRPPSVNGVKADWYADLTPALVDTWDAAIVSTPTARHEDAVDLLLRAGVPVLCEKPLSTDPATTARLGELADGLGVPLRCGLQRRLDPALLALRTIVASGRLGRLLHAHSATFDPAPPPPEYLRRSGGIFIDMHIHDFDVVAWLLDDEIETVRAVGAPGLPEVFGDLDDHGVSQVGVVTRAGVVASISGSRWSAGGYLVRAAVSGTRGEAWMDARGQVSVLDGTGDQVVRPGDPDIPDGFATRFAQAYLAEIHAFLDEVAGGTAAPVDRSGPRVDVAGPAAGLGRCADWRDDLRALTAAMAAGR